MVSANSPTQGWIRRAQPLRGTRNDSVAATHIAAVTVHAATKCHDPAKSRSSRSPQADSAPVRNADRHSANAAGPILRCDRRDEVA